MSSRGCLGIVNKGYQHLSPGIENYVSQFSSPGIVD